MTQNESRYAGRVGGRGKTCRGGAAQACWAGRRVVRYVRDPRRMEKGERRQTPEGRFARIYKVNKGASLHETAWHTQVCCLLIGARGSRVRGRLGSAGAGGVATGYPPGCRLALMSPHRQPGARRRCAARAAARAGTATRSVMRVWLHGCLGSLRHAPRSEIAWSPDTRPPAVPAANPRRTTPRCAPTCPWRPRGCRR